ncbi:hypothetical protein QE193_24495 (plasmid) [Arsenophonus nasoniae]|uniref:hypothetical protein n=1 Tax=Arsenophonus nasoniae TaxID=638 RepID=UPI002468BDEB|nr:hypothetical protein [Arsenophonus nasoniae]WGM18366.1 hypothetical protein QE193_24495 [Arsenophonus nasoniae]
MTAKVDHLGNESANTARRIKPVILLMTSAKGQETGQNPANWAKSSANLKALSRGDSGTQDYERVSKLF